MLVCHAVNSPQGWLRGRGSRSGRASIRTGCIRCMISVGTGCFRCRSAEGCTWCRVVSGGGHTNRRIS
eukprot:scaffold120955_cov16-Tisochrysis_lutea.AAC.1